MFFADLEQNQITANATVIGGITLLRHLAAQGESVPSPDGTRPAATLSHSALAAHFQQQHPDANFNAALELLLRREVIEIVPQSSTEAKAEARNRVSESESQTDLTDSRQKPGFSTEEPHYKFQVELIRQWFLR